MDIISYNKEEIESKMAKMISATFKQLFKEFHFDKNPTLTEHISKLSDQYNKYKESYNFPTKYKGNDEYIKNWI